MKLASKDRSGFLETQRFRWWRLRKRVHQFLRYRPGVDKTVVYIVGCQRSGTSMLSHLFRRDLDAVTYDEVSPLSAGDLRQGLRWSDLSEAKARITADRAPLVVAKPLVESQNLTDLVGLFPETRVVWMYRHFEDVAASNVAFFEDGTSHHDLRPILDGDSRDWRFQNLAPEVTDLIRERAAAGLSAHDAAALFWYARNSLFFSQGYGGWDQVRTCRYSDLVTRPVEVMSQTYRFLDRPWPGEHIVQDVFSGSKGRGKGIVLAPDIGDLCGELLTRLDATRRLGCLNSTAD